MSNLAGVLNFMILLLSIPILASGIWLANGHGTDCEKFLQGPLIIIGVFMMVVSLAGFIGACFRVSWLLWIYLIVMFLLIVLLLCFIIFAFAVKVPPGQGYKENRLGNFSYWLQKRLQNADNWRIIKICLRDAKVCKALSRDDPNLPATEFYQRNLSLVQSGCCKPPSSCVYVYRNATYWDGVPPPASDASDGDCVTWSNAQDELCHSCNSCKAGVLASVEHNWRKVPAINIVLLIFLIADYSVGSRAFRNNGSSWCCS